MAISSPARCSYSCLRNRSKAGTGSRVKILITGSAGLIGSEAVSYFGAAGEELIGIDNNLRADFFGPEGDTTWNLTRLQHQFPGFRNFAIDIRDREAIADLFERERPDAVIHCAAQPSHDLAARRPFDDFEVNATGTLNLLEAARRSCPEAPFVFMSTNKVYGDAPNELPLVELHTRWDYARPEDLQGIDETLRVDQTKHSLFGASKLAADVLVQEYGRYFAMPTACFRGGCLTGPNHSGVELHGFLSYLIKSLVTGRRFRIYGYKGKQVRDQIHSRDVVAAFDAFIRAPRVAAVYNLGGGRANSISVLEAIAATERRTNRSLDFQYVEANRLGDHICYISDLTKLRRDYPAWNITWPLDRIIDEMVQTELQREAEQRFVSSQGLAVGLSG
jgi:CDP-paratose 2-epimerase